VDVFHSGVYVLKRLEHAAAAERRIDRYSTGNAKTRNYVPARRGLPGSPVGM